MRLKTTAYGSIRKTTHQGFPSIRRCFNQTPRSPAAVEDDILHASYNSGPGSLSTFLLASRESPRTRYWTAIPRWSGIPEEEFLSYRFQSRQSISRQKIIGLLSECLPDFIPGRVNNLVSRAELVADVQAAMESANMAIRITPHIASMIQWTDPLNCPIFRQFIGTKSGQQPDHEEMKLDSLHEEDDSPVPGVLVHRYQDRVLFLVAKTCPVYCRFCTRSYAVGDSTPANKKHRVSVGYDEMEQAFIYLEQHPTIRDVVVSGGDTFHLEPSRLRSIGERLLRIPHIRELRFASKGLAVCPSRFLDPHDRWASTLFDISAKARAMDKEIALHTHFNSAREINWVSREAAKAIFQAGVTVRNQSVLLRGVNDSVKAMSALLRELRDMHIKPLYVYQADMVKGTEDLRTPLSTAIDLEVKLRGSINGHHMPHFVVDLPGGGGKRSVSTYASYDEKTGVSTWEAPAVKPGRVFRYFDPLLGGTNTDNEQIGDRSCRTGTVD